MAEALKSFFVRTRVYLVATCLVIFGMGASSAMAAPLCSRLFAPRLYFAHDPQAQLPEFLRKIKFTEKLSDQELASLRQDFIAWAQEHGLRIREVPRELSQQNAFASGVFFEILPNSNPGAHLFNRLAASVRDRARRESLPMNDQISDYQVWFAIFRYSRFEGAVDTMNRIIYLDVDTVARGRVSAVMDHELRHFADDLRAYRGELDPLSGLNVGWKPSAEDPRGLAAGVEFSAVRLSNELALRDLKRIYQTSGRFQYGDPGSKTFKTASYLLHQINEMAAVTVKWDAIRAGFLRWLSLNQVVGRPFAYSQVSGHSISAEAYFMFANHPLEYLAWPVTKPLGVFDQIKSGLTIQLRLSPQEHAQVLQAEAGSLAKYERESFRYSPSTRDLIRQKINLITRQIEIFQESLLAYQRAAGIFEKEQNIENFKKLEDAHQRFAADFARSIRGVVDARN